VKLPFKRKAKRKSTVGYYIASVNHAQSHLLATIILALASTLRVIHKPLYEASITNKIREFETV
jgi:hypothetical protein